MVLKILRRCLNNLLRTKTKEINEFDGLDPWVQWLSIHLGIPREIHGVTHLGELSNSNNKVIWHQLTNSANIKWLVWGVINTPIGCKNGCQAFVPDPWLIMTIHIHVHCDG